MQRVAANHHIKFVFREGQAAHIAGAKRNILETEFRGAFARDGQHGLSQIDANHFASYGGESLCDVSRSASHVEYAFLAAQAGRTDESLNHLFVANPRAGRERSRLLRELFAYYIVVLTHSFSSAGMPAATLLK